MTFDIVIVGGGLSGLALAAELARPEFSKLRVLVLEQRANYLRDRTWSYWRTSHNAAHPYSYLERRQWRRWNVRQDDCADNQASTTVTKTGDTEFYCSLDADQFYAAARRAIAQSHHVKIRLAITVRNIVDGDTPSVETFEGEVIDATWVFDARPPIKTSVRTLVQQFLGYEIKTDRDVFDPTTVGLMYFRPSNDGLHFFYVLPYSPRNALVETTWISAGSFKPDFITELTQFIVGSLGPAGYDVVYEEKGSLDLSLHINQPNRASHVVPLGLGAGTLRASTGYAFLATLEHAEKIAASLQSCLIAGDLKHWVPVIFKRRALDVWMDTVFFNVLEHDWVRASQYFMQLFERVDADTMVAFLSGRASWRQRVSVASALPILPFAAQALATLIGVGSKLLGVRR